MTENIQKFCFRDLVTFARKIFQENQYFLVQSNLYEGHVNFCSLGPNFGVSPAAGKTFYLQITFEKKRVFVVFNQKHGTNFKIEINKSRKKWKHKVKSLKQKLLNANLVVIKLDKSICFSYVNKFLFVYS